MGDKTGIGWTDATWNPVTGCTKVSKGCAHCYAEGVADRFWATQFPPVETADGERPRRFTDVRTHPERLDQPLRWRKPRRIFVNSMSDLFHPDVPDEFVARVFDIMAACPQHTFQILTKRPERMRDLLLKWAKWDRFENVPPLIPLPNVWLGVSVEDQAAADARIPLLLETPAAVRFLSCEPLLGPVDLASVPLPEFRDGVERSWPGVDWVIVGGESGPRARPMDLAWARSLVEQCRTAGVATFVKQLGSRPVYAVDNRSGDGMDVRVMGATSLHTVPGVYDRKGADPEEWPEDLRVQDYPLGVTP